MIGFLIILILFLVICSITVFVDALDNITTTQFMKDGDTMVSSNGSFEMGFFRPGNSKNRYVGVWYNKIVTTRTVVWVANRQVPVNDTSGMLKVIYPGILILVNGNNNTIWSTNTSRTVQNPVAELLDSGNLVIRDANDENPENFLWQGFDYPSDTLLPGMKMGKNFVKGIETYISSWKSADDPAQGSYSAHCTVTGYPQITLQNGSTLLSRSGPWNGIRFSGTSNLFPNTNYTYELVFNEKEVNNSFHQLNSELMFNEKEVYYSFHLLNRSIVSRFAVNPNGLAQRWTWVNRTRDWLVYLAAPIDNCDYYAICGAYGSCNIGGAPICGCLNKFVPRIKDEWDNTDWTNGCVRKVALDCKNGDGFLKYERLKLPDTKDSWFNTTMTLEECETVCLQNCSCTAYTNLDIRGGGSGCLLWFGELIDIREFSEGGQDIFIRMASSELATQSGSNGKEGNILKVILPIIFGVVLVGASLTLYAWRKKKKIPPQRASLKKFYGVFKNLHNENNIFNVSGRFGKYTEQDYKDDSNNDDQLPLFSLATLVNVTNNFAIENKLGEGGFGVVYKGVMEDGQEIAVKRLSKTSTQGLDEFKNEVICISKLQHRNLVKLQGCCIQVDEKMLVYEFMPNKSLDSFLFDESKSMTLDWPKRFHIIKGIARGLVYLHQDSRLRIIHRDLKASNILLDHEMNPKISDFGLARSVGGNETGANTNRVVGTYGYMSPEYAADGLFSIKSDVFSFGVIVIEIVSGKKNRGFFHLEQFHNLLGHAWRLYKEGRPQELMDKSLATSLREHEMLRSIQVGLLCAQQNLEDRPTMSSVVTMLDSEGPLPQPKQPGFFTEKSTAQTECSSSSSTQPSVNEVTITQLAAR